MSIATQVWYQLKWCIMSVYLIHSKCADESNSWPSSSSCSHPPRKLDGARSCSIQLSGSMRALMKMMVMLHLNMVIFKGSITIICIIALITKVCQCPEPIVERHGFPHHPIAYEINHKPIGWVADCCWWKKAAWFSHRSQAGQLPMLPCCSIFF